MGLEFRGVSYPFPLRCAPYHDGCTFSFSFHIPVLYPLTPLSPLPHSPSQLSSSPVTFANDARVKMFSAYWQEMYSKWQEELMRNILDENSPKKSNKKKEKI